MNHVPAHCRNAKVVLLGPLTRRDIDVSSFTNREPTIIEKLTGSGPRYGLMAQGLQRTLDGSGNVKLLNEPSPELLASLNNRVTVFLSDVETDVWPPDAVSKVARQSQHLIITRGGAGADQHTPHNPEVPKTFPPYEIADVLDTNGAGDSFAMAFMIAAASRHKFPAEYGNYVGAMAVRKPQSCKPDCIGDALRSGQWPVNRVTFWAQLKKS